MSETPFSKITKRDKGNDLNNMPGTSDVQRIAELRMEAEEKLATLKPDSRQARKIRQALADLDAAHSRADHHDSSNQCSDRHLIRRRRGI